MHISSSNSLYVRSSKAIKGNKKRTFPFLRTEKQQRKRKRKRKRRAKERDREIEIEID